MYIQTQKTPNPNSLKFIPGKNVSKIGSIEIHDKSETDNVLLKSIFDINGVNSIFLDETFLTINKREENNWEDIKHIILSLLNDYYINGKETILDKQIVQKKNENYQEIEKQIIKILETKIKPAVARDGGDIKFVEFKEGVVKVQLRGSCAGCPSSIITLKQGVQNLLTHYIPDVKQVTAV
tara:strand:- start:8439 stop:8981 length:543 start_codon:yes stop_codon:yes gene_type:complete